MDLNSIPEHQQLREAALKNLVSMQPEVPILPPATVTERKKEPVVDEFTYSDKPLAPLYVPIQPAAPVVLPPASIIKEVAKLPMIPGVSARNQAAASLNAKSPLQIDVQRGPQILPGLHAAMPASTGWENPVQDSRNTVAELVAAMNPTTYLMAMPLDKKMAKPTSFASSFWLRQATSLAVRRAFPSRAGTVSIARPQYAALAVCPANTGFLVRGHEKVPTGGQVAVPAGGHDQSPVVAK